MQITNTLIKSEYTNDQLDIAERARIQELESILSFNIFSNSFKCILNILHQQRGVKCLAVNRF